MMKKKVSRRIEKKYISTIKSSSIEQKTGELRLQKEFWDKRAE